MGIASFPSWVFTATSQTEIADTAIVVCSAASIALRAFAESRSGEGLVEIFGDAD